MAQVLSGRFRTGAGEVGMRREGDFSSQKAHASELPDLITAKDLEAILKIDAKTIYSYVQRWFRQTEFGPL